MAEFSEVMRQWRRFCKSHNNCGECEFDGKGICGEAHLTDIPYADIELRIMAWAAEHPEPVYPTWGEWFVSRGMLPEKWDNLTSAYMNVGCVPNLIHSPIPADVAEKLGVKPKEAK